MHFFPSFVDTTQVRNLNKVAFCIVGCNRLDSFSVGLSASRSILMPSADLAALNSSSAVGAPNVKLDLYFDPKAKDFRLLMNQVLAIMQPSSRCQALRIG